MTRCVEPDAARNPGCGTSTSGPSSAHPSLACRGYAWQAGAISFGRTLAALRRSARCGLGARSGSWRVTFPPGLRWPARGNSPPLVRRQGPLLRHGPWGCSGAMGVVGGGADDQAASDGGLGAFRWSDVSSRMQREDPRRGTLRPRPPQARRGRRATRLYERGRAGGVRDRGNGSRKAEEGSRTTPRAGRAGVRSRRDGRASCRDRSRPAWPARGPDVA